MNYVDVRGPWPVLVVGLKAIVLEGVSRDITIEEAMQYL